MSVTRSVTRRTEGDAGQDRVPPLPELTLELRLPGAFTTATFHSPQGTLSGTLRRDGEWHHLHLRDVPLYGIAALRRD